jgi:hypothetical protein
MKTKWGHFVFVGWTILTIAFSACDSFSMELIFKDAQYSFQTLRALGYAASGGADVGEVLKTAYWIKEGDDENWYEEWNKTAEQREKAAEDFLSGATKSAPGRSTSGLPTTSGRLNFFFTPIRRTQGF